MNSRRIPSTVIYSIRSLAENQVERKTYTEVTSPKSRMSANFIMPAYILLYHISFTAARRKFVAMRACAIYNEAARDL